MVTCSLASLLFFAVAVSATIPTVSLDTSQPASVQPQSGIANSADTRINKAEIDGRLETRFWTNGRRLAAGMPPNPPILRQRQVTTANKPPPKPSGKPDPKTDLHGCIKAYDLARKLLGYISQGYAQHGQFSLTDDEKKCLKVAFPSIGKGISIRAENSPTSNMPYLGCTVGAHSKDSSMKSGNDHYVYLTSSLLTPRGSRPVDGGNSYTQSTGQMRSCESSLFSFDQNTNKIGLDWVNPDGSSKSISLAWIENAIVGFADPTTFSKTYGNKMTRMTLEYSPLD